MNSAITARLADLITVAERLKATVEAERPDALLPTFEDKTPDSLYRVERLRRRMRRCEAPEDIERVACQVERLAAEALPDGVILHEAPAGS